MRKVELLPTRDCEAGYGPGQICHLSVLSIILQHAKDLTTVVVRWWGRNVWCFTVALPSQKPFVVQIESSLILIFIVSDYLITFFLRIRYCSLFGTICLNWKYFKRVHQPLLFALVLLVLCFLRSNLPSPRTEILHNIDPIPYETYLTARASLRMGDWKLIVGNPCK